MPNGFVIPFASCLARVCDFIFCSFFRVWFVLFCSAILVLMGKVFWFLAGKVPPFAVAYWDFCDSAGR